MHHGKLHFYQYTVKKKRKEFVVIISLKIRVIVQHILSLHPEGFMVLSSSETVCCVFATSSGWVLCCWRLSQSQRRQWESYWSTVSGGETLWNATTANLKRRTTGWIKSINALLLSKYIYYQIYNQSGSRNSLISAFYNSNFTNGIIKLSAGWTIELFLCPCIRQVPWQWVLQYYWYYRTYCKQDLDTHSCTLITSHVFKPGPSDCFTVWHLKESCAADDEWVRFVV